MTLHLQLTVEERSSSRSRQRERAVRVVVEEEGYWTLAPASGLARERGRGRRGVVTLGEGGGGALEGRARVKGSEIRASCHLEMMKKRTKINNFAYSGHKIHVYIIPWNLSFFSFYTISLHFFFAHSEINTWHSHNYYVGQIVWILHILKLLYS